MVLLFVLAHAAEYRGVSIESPTFLSASHKEYDHVCWASCPAWTDGDDETRRALETDGRAPLATDLAPLNTSAWVSGERAACLAQAAFGDFPGMNVVRVPIMPGGSIPSKEGELGRIRESAEGFCALADLTRREEPAVLRSAREAWVDRILRPIVRVASEHRAAVIVDWHYIGDYKSLGFKADEEPVPWSSFSECTADFWEAARPVIDGLQTEYPAAPIYAEVFNEPVVYGDQADAADRATAKAAWEVGMQGVLSGFATDSAVIMGGPRWSSPMAKDSRFSLQPTAAKVWWADHWYTDMNEKVPAHDVSPVFATEVGLPHGGLPYERLGNAQKAEHLCRFQRLLKHYDGQYGWVVWSYSVQNTPGLLSRKFPKRTPPSDIPLRASGEVLRGWFLNPGDPTCPQ